MTGPGLQFETGANSHAGRVRSVNEDSIIVKEDAGIWLVADGVGGHTGGKLASSMIVDEVAAIGAASSAAELLDRFSEGIAKVSRQIALMSQGGEAYVMASTVAALLVFGRHFACVWAGDSRVYLVRGGDVSQLSRDHSEVQELVDGGSLTREEAQNWPRRNIITRAVGIEADPRLDLNTGELHDDDIFILCSDGLSNHVRDEEIGHTARRLAAQRASDALLQLALDRGGKDNISVIVVKARVPQSATVVPGR